MHPSSEFGQNLIDVYAKVQRIQGLQEVHQLDFAQGRERVGSDIYGFTPNKCRHDLLLFQL